MSLYSFKVSIWIILLRVFFSVREDLTNTLIASFVQYLDVSLIIPLLEADSLYDIPHEAEYTYPQVTHLRYSYIQYFFDLAMPPVVRNQNVEY